MNTYKNYVYMTICEISYECSLEYHKVNYRYQNYCQEFKLALDNGFLTKRQCKDILKITSIVEKIYGLREEEIAILISEYFNKKNLRDYEKVLSSMNLIVPDYFRYNIHFKK